MKKQLSSQPGARRLAVALALCAALLLCLGHTALAQTERIEGFTFNLPDTLRKDYTQYDGFCYVSDNGPEHHELRVGINHCFSGETYFGLTQDWIYEQLEKGDGEYMQNLIHGQPTLFLQAVDEELHISYALAATTLNSVYVIGFEKRTDTTQPIGDVLLEVISSAESYVPQIKKGVSGMTPAPTGELGLGQKETIKGLTFTLPDTFERYSKTGNNDAFIYRVEDDRQDVVQALAVGIGRCYDEEIRFGVTLDWIYEQLDQGGESIQNLVHGQPTLFLQKVDEERGTSNALAAIKVNGLYIIGAESQRTTQPAGDLLLEVLSSIEGYDPQVMEDVSSTPEPTPTPQPAASKDALFSSSDSREDTSLKATRQNYLGDPDERRASDDFLFCGIDWDTDLDTALRIIAANTDREMEYAENGSYMGLSYGSPFWGLNEEECFLTLINVYPEENGWWLECQLTPEQVEFADTSEAVKFFDKAERALETYKCRPATFTLVVDGEEMEITDPDSLISLWEDAVGKGHESVRAYADFNNLTLSMEKDLYGDMNYMTCWLTLGPGAR